jgi:DNA-directed RNA polymerase specialized sigma24 family protein
MAVPTLPVDLGEAGGFPQRHRTRVEFDTELTIADAHNLDLVALDEALNAFSAIDPRRGRVVELRFFAGLTVEETAGVLEIQPRR